MEINEITKTVIGAAIEVHRVMGPGLLESAYRVCLAHEMALRGLSYEQERSLPVCYKGVQLDAGYRLDFMIERAVVVELKAVETLLPIHEAQVLTYLRLTGCKVGLLINFHVPVLKQGLKRLAL
jgi:GxxExxY protein